MRFAHSAAEVRAAEDAAMAVLPPGALMHRAAAALAAHCLRLLGGAYGRRVLVLAGAGNNGGDALYAGARLAARGARVDVALVGGGAHDGGLAALRRAGGRVASADVAGGQALLERADLVVDGILGIGGRGALREPAAGWAAAVAQAGVPVVAVDVPSGVDADTGVVAGHAVRADVTVTFGTGKPGLLVDPGASYAGVVVTADIGLGPFLPEAQVAALQSQDVAAVLPQPAGIVDKYRRGVLGVVAGSDRYPGAAVLCTGAAVRMGAGMARFVSAPGPATAVRAAWPEALVTDLDPALRGTARGQAVLDVGRVQAWAVGPGMGTDEDAADVLATVLATDLPVVIDADGLTVLARTPALTAGRNAPTLLTPHAGELARLLGGDPADIEASRLHSARAAAQRYGATVLLKGSTTVVAAPDGTVRVNATGTPLLATAGSGDVLTGAAGALLAGGLGALDAGSVAAYLHGLAARLAARGPAGGAAPSPAEAPVIARDVLDALPAAVRTVRR